MKGQFQHVFTFIMLIIIAGVVLLLGYKFIFDIGDRVCEVEALEFKNQLAKDLKSYSSYGSFHLPELSVPCEAIAICFADADLYGDETEGIYAGTATFTHTNPVIQQEVRAPSTPPSNVFIITADDNVQPLQLFSEKIDVLGEVLCVNATSGRFHLGFEGKGRTVTITDES